MTIADATDNVRTLVTNGVATSWALSNLRFKGPQDLVVVHTASGDGGGATTPWTYGIHYTLSGSSLTGNATLVALGGAPATGSIKVRRRTPPRQELPASMLHQLNSADFEAALDDLARQIGDADTAKQDAAVILSDLAGLETSLQRGDILMRGAHGLVRLPAAQPEFYLKANGPNADLSYDKPSVAVIAPDGDVLAAIADQATAIAGLSNETLLSPLRAAQQAAARSSAISPLSYGVLGSADDHDAIQAAINNASAGQTVLMPAGLFMTSALDFTGRQFVGAGPGKTILQLVGAPAKFLTAAGLLGADILLTADAEAGDTVLELVSTAGLTSGMAIVVRDSYSYVASAANYKSGETVRIVQVIDGTDIEIYPPLAGSAKAGGAYETAESARINVVSLAGRTAIRDMTIIGLWNSPTRLIDISYAHGARVEGVELRDNGGGAIIMHGCLDSSVDDYLVDNLRDQVGGGFSGYGVVLSGPCDNVSIKRGKASRCRHAVTTIGGATGYRSAHHERHRQSNQGIAARSCDTR